MLFFILFEKRAHNLNTFFEIKNKSQSESVNFSIYFILLQILNSSLTVWFISLFKYLLYDKKLRSSMPLYFIIVRFPEQMT